MATKQPQAPTAVVEAQSTGLALPNDVLARLAGKAKDVAAAERPSVSKISLKSGMMSYGGNPMPGNKVEAIILAAVYRHSWYSKPYDQNNVVNPDCFAFALSEDGMAPDKVVEHPVNATCKGCPKLEWKSDPRPGSKGKACKQSRRLVLIPATVLADDDPVNAIKTAELAIIDLPVTSSGGYSNFVNGLAASANVPPYAAVTQISTQPDAKTQFKVNFTPLRVVPSVEILEAIEARIAEAERIGLQGYEEAGSGKDTASPQGADAPVKF